MTNEYHEEEVFNGKPFIGLDGHTYHWEHKCGNSWSSHSLIDDTMVEIEKSRKEAEQKKEEQKEVKVDMSEETRKRLEKLAPMSIIKIGWKAEAETSPYDGSITRVSFCEVVDGYPTKEEALIAFVEEQKGKKYGDNFLPPEGYTNGKERKIMERLEALEKDVDEQKRLYQSCFSGVVAHERLQGQGEKMKEMDDRLKALEKKVEELEKWHKEIYEFAGLEYLEEKPSEPIRAVEGTTTQKPKEENEARSVSEEDMKHANLFRCPKCEKDFRVGTSVDNYGFVMHCPFCGEEPKRIKD